MGKVDKRKRNHEYNWIELLYAINNKWFLVATHWKDSRKRFKNYKNVWKPFENGKRLEQTMLTL